MRWVGPDGTILRVNRAELEFLGYDAADYVGHHVAEFHADKAAIQDILERLHRNEPVRDHEARMIRADGSVIDVLIDSSVLWRNGEFIHTRCITRDNSAQKAAESRIRASEDRYRQIIETANEGVVIIDAEARLTYVNDRFAAMIGYEREKLLGVSAADLTDDEGRAQLEANLARRRQGIAENFDFRFVHATGRPVWAIVSATPLTDANGGFAGSLGMITDITQRRMAEDAVIESEARWRLIADSMPAMVSISDASGQVVYCNEQFVNYTGISREEHRAGGWVRMLHPDDVKRHIDEWNATLPRGKPFTVEYRARRADGVYRWHLGRVQPVRGADGKIAMWIGAHLDIQDRMEIEQALRESEARFRHLADAMPQIVWAAGPDGRPDYFNRRWYDYTGFSPDEPFESILHPDDANFTRHIWLDSVRTGEPYQIEYRFYDRFTGGYRWHLGRAMPVRNDAGEIVRWFGTSTDIDSQKRTEEALRRANEAKDEFLGLVSHELKTPITTIFGNAEVLRLRADQLDAASRTAALEDIGNEAERLHRIVENLLVLARLDQGESVHVEPILIRRLVSKLIADHERRFPHRKLTFEANKELIPILGEPTYAEQVLRNLLSNAEKYSPPDRPIEITLQRRGDELEISVLDRGIGFDGAEAEKLFTPFYRSPRAAQHTPGVGIGLAVCKRLIEVQGGRMWARSRPGGGADIGFALPVETEDPAQE